MHSKGGGGGCAAAPHLDPREGRLDEVIHLLVGELVPPGHLVVRPLPGLPFALLVQQVALPDPGHLLPSQLGRLHRRSQQLPQIHRLLRPGQPVQEGREAAAQEARVDMIEHAERQQAEHADPQRGQTDPHGRHGDGSLRASGRSGLPALGNKYTPAQLWIL
uniref:Uncharacterized protein n=1 Tax=Leptobrachium leishanense TaxID=445787 RepID=A0A8C5ME13_9ANUR